MDLNTDEFLHRLQLHDNDAWREFVEDLVPRMFAYALRHVKSRATAEDIAEETMSRVVSAIGDFTYEGVPLDVWVYKIERNVLTDYYRHHTNRSMLPFEEFMDGHSTGLLRDPYELAEAADTRAIILQAIDTLQEPRRSVVRLRLLEGRSVHEVAFLLGLSESNVKVLLFRALGQIRSIVADRMGEVHGQQ